MKTRIRERGNIIAFMLLAMVLIGAVIALLTQGGSRSAQAVKLDELTLFLRKDLESIHAAVNECALSYPGKVDIDGDGNDDLANPNVPFPVYGDLSSGAAGEVLNRMRCPAAPLGAYVFGADMGNRLRLLHHAVDYETLYFNDAADGVYIRITRLAPDPDALWEEAMRRLNAAFAPCAAAADLISDPQRFYYWIVRRSPGSGIGAEAGCP